MRDHLKGADDDLNHLGARRGATATTDATGIGKSPLTAPLATSTASKQPPDPASSASGGARVERGPDETQPPHEVWPSLDGLFGQTPPARGEDERASPRPPATHERSESSGPVAGTGRGNAEPGGPARGTTRAPGMTELFGPIARAPAPRETGAASQAPAGVAGTPAAGPALAALPVHAVPPTAIAAGSPQSQSDAPPHAAGAKMTPATAAHAVAPSTAGASTAHGSPVAGSTSAPHAPAASSAHAGPASGVPADRAPIRAPTFKAPASSGAAGDAAREIEATVTTESARLSLAFDSKRQALQTAASTQAVALVAAATTEHAATLGALTDREQSSRAVFAAARANVATTQITQTVLARADVTGALQRMRGGSDGIVGQIRGGAQREAARMQTAASDAAQSIQTSGNALRSEILGYPIGNLRAIVADLEPEEISEVQSSLGEAKRSAAGAVVSSDSQAAAKLTATATENANAFDSAATSVVDQVNAKLPEIEQSIHAGGEAVATLIEHMAASQLAGIDTAEREVLAQLADAKAHAVNVLHAGQTAAADLQRQARSHVAALTTQEAAAHQQLHAAGTQATTQLSGSQDAPRAQAHAFAGKVSAALHQGNDQQLAALDQSVAPALTQVGGAASTFATVIRERRDRMLAGLDAAIGGAGTQLAQGLGELTQQCTAFRAEATGTYANAEAQFATAAQPGLQSAQQTWQTKAGEFVASCHAYQSESLGKHAQVRAELPAKMTSVVSDTVAYLRRSTARRILDGIKSGLGAIGHGLVVFVVAVIVVAAVIVAFIGSAFIGLATVVALLVVGAVMLAVGLVTAFVNRLRMLWNNDWPWWAKIIGISVAFGVAVGDTLGLSQITEAIRGRELISDRTLSTEERSARMTEGLFQVITLGLIKRFSRSRAPTARGTGELPPGSRRALPPTETVPKSEPMPAEDVAQGSARSAGSEVAPVAEAQSAPADLETAGKPATAAGEPAPAHDPASARESSPTDQDMPSHEPAAAHERSPVREAPSGEPSTSSAAEWLDHLIAQLNPEELAQYEKMRAKWRTPQEMKDACAGNLDLAKQAIRDALGGESRSTGPQECVLCARRRDSRVCQSAQPAAIEGGSGNSRWVAGRHNTCPG